VGAGNQLVGRGRRTTASPGVTRNRYSGPACRDAGPVHSSDAPYTKKAGSCGDHLQIKMAKAPTARRPANSTGGRSVTICWAVRMGDVERGSPAKSINEPGSWPVALSESGEALLKLREGGFGGLDCAAAGQAAQGQRQPGRPLQRPESR